MSIYSVTDLKPPGQQPSDDKHPRIIEEIIAKYAVDANLFRLGSTNPKKNYGNLSHGKLSHDKKSHGEKS